MKLTTKGRFAVTAMVDIAMRARESDAPVPIAQVAERQKISLAYLEQIFCRLRRAGLVESTRGPAGGYKLSEPASQITIDRIVLAVDENMDTTQCRGEGTCLGGAACLTHHLWEELLASRSLECLIEEHEAREAAEAESSASVSIPAVIPVRKSA